LLFIAAKSEEKTVPNAKEFHAVHFFPLKQVFYIDCEILSILNFQLAPKTPWTWVKLFIGNTVHMASFHIAIVG
jgi:hypothetical protein